MAFVQEGIQLSLDPDRELVDFCQVDSAALGATEDAAGCIATVAEEFGLEDGLWHGAALKFFEGGGTAAACIMEGAGDHVLTDAKFAFQEDCAVGISDATGDFEDALDRIAVSDELGGSRGAGGGDRWEIGGAAP